MSQEEAAEVMATLLEALPDSRLRLHRRQPKSGFGPYIGQDAKEVYTHSAGDKVLVELSLHDTKTRANNVSL